MLPASRVPPKVPGTRFPGTFGNPPTFSLSRFCLEGFLRSFLESRQWGRTFQVPPKVPEGSRGPPRVPEGSREFRGTLRTVPLRSDANDDDDGWWMVDGGGW